MEENTPSEGVEQQPAEVEQVPEDEGRDRRSFLTRTAMGVAGAAGVLALGANSARAAEASKASIKSRIIDRIRSQMAVQDELLQDGGGDAGVYVKNSHALYLK
jgi:hypothetical protein